MSIALLQAGLTALTASVILTPLITVVMARLGVVDRPDGRRKLHGREVPLAGGLAIWLALAGTLIADRYFGDSGHGTGGGWTWLLLASGVLCGVGLADDAFGLRGRHKLLGQLLPVSMLVGSGLVVEQVDLLGFDVHLGVMAVPFTMFWLLGAINAINLIDGMDGLASTIGGMIAFALGLMAAMTGQRDEAIIATALAGGLAGFLIFNLPPARVFLGDTGSMMIGLVLGVVAIRSSLKGPATFAAAAPVAIWTLPILDVCMAILRRKLTGRSIYTTDRGHLHHRLGDRGLSTWRSLLLVVALCGVTTAGALASVAWRSEWLAPASAIAVFGILVLTRSFGHSECALLARRARSFAASLLPTQAATRPMGREHRSRLQGTREWDQLWDSLVEFAERFGLTSVQLDVSLPAQHEAFFASWNHVGCDSGQLFKVDLPLSAGSAPIGWLRLTGRCPGGSAFGWVGELVDGLRPFETQIADLLVDDGARSGLPNSDTNKRSFIGARDETASAFVGAQG